MQSKLAQQLPLDQMQNKWAAQLDPVIKNPTNNSSILKNVSLVSGTNVVNHKLGRPLQGWNPTRIRASATFYDMQDTNQTPQLTLVLVSSATVIIDLEVF